MQIITQPDSISLVGNIKHIVVSTDTDIRLVLSVQNEDNEWETVVQHTYSPNASGIVEIDAKTIVLPLLSLTIQDISTPYRQENIVRTFSASITALTSEGDADTDSCTFKAIRAGVDSFDGDAESFLLQNFLTWQPNVKPVTYYTPEFLTYFAVQNAKVMCRIYITQESSQDFTIASIPQGECWTIPVQYAVMASLLPAGTLPLYYDVWVENLQGERQTYIQRYYADSMRSEQEEWILFENSLGGIDTFRAYGESESSAEHTHNVAEINENLEEYRVDTNRNHKKNTGHLGKRERRWLLDFFPSLGKYIYTGNFIRRIVVTESDVAYHARVLPSSYSFTYRYSDQTPYLNIPRAEVPQAALDISVPDVGSFTVAPRLVEFPRLSLSSGALIPVQSPYSESWAATTVAALLEFIANALRESYSGGGGVGHQHPNIALLNALALADGYLLANTDKIKAAFADMARDISPDSPANDRFLSSLYDDIAQGLLTLKKGLQLGDGDTGITAAGAATLESLQTKNYSGPDLVADKGLRIWEDSNGKSHLVTDFFAARMKAFFAVLEYKKTEHSAGNETKSPAGGTIALVRKYNAERDELKEHFVAHTFFGHLIHMLGGFFGHKYVPASEDIAFFRCYFAAEDDEKGVTNDWRVGDQAFCQTYNLRQHNSSGVAYGVTNKRYWRLVVNTGYEVIDGKEYAFIDLANILAWTITIDGVAHDCIGYEDINDIGVPQAGDDVAAFGSQIYPDTRGGAVQIVTCGENDGGRLPAVRIYAGINNFDLTGHLVKESSPAREMVRADRFEIVSASGTGDSSGITCQRGQWYTGAESGHYDVWQHHGSTWLCIVESGTTTTTEPSDSLPLVWRKYASRGMGTPQISLDSTNAVISAGSDGKISSISAATGLPTTIELYVDGEQIPVSAWDLAHSHIKWGNNTLNLTGQQAMLAFGVVVDDIDPTTNDVGLTWAYEPETLIGLDGIRRVIHPVINSFEIAIDITFTYNGETHTAYTSMPAIVQKAAASVQAEYSADNSSWHPDLRTTDLYVRYSYDGGTTWTQGTRFVGKSIEFNKGIRHFASYSDLMDYLVSIESAMTERDMGYYIADTDDGGTPEATLWYFYTQSSDPRDIVQVSITNEVNYLTSYDGHLWNADSNSSAWADMGVIQGADGVDGISVTLDPATVIFEQNEDNINTFTPSPSSFTATVNVWKGTTPLAPNSYKVAILSTTNCSATTSGNQIASLTLGQDSQGVYHPSGSVVLGVWLDPTSTSQTPDTTLTFNWAASLLGKWKLKVKEEVMEAVSQKTVAYTKEDGTVESVAWETAISQNSQRIALTAKKDDLETAGIHLDGENSSIDLRANKTLFSRPDGTPFIKVGADENGIGYLIFMMPDGVTPAYNLGYTGLPDIINTSQEASFSNPLQMAKLSAQYSDYVENGIPCSTLYLLATNPNLSCYYRYNQSRIKQGDDWVLVPLSPNHDGKYYDGNTLDTANQSLPASTLTELDNVAPVTTAGEFALWVGACTSLKGWDDSRSQEQYVRMPMIKLDATFTLYWVQNSKIVRSEQIVVTREKMGQNSEDVYYVTDPEGMTDNTYFLEE